MDNFEKVSGDDVINDQGSPESSNGGQKAAAKRGKNNRNPENQKNGHKNRIAVKFPQVFNATTIVALLALLVSFTTTLISYRQAATQNIQNQKNELRSLLQRTIALPKESAELMMKYQDNPEAASLISTYQEQENQLLFNQIDHLLSVIPQEQLSAIEYYSASTALYNSSEFSRAKEYAAKSMAMAVNAKNFNLQLTLLRLNAQILFHLGEYDEGRAYYEKALNIFEEGEAKYSHLNDFSKLSWHIQTELCWAISEGLSSNFDNIHTHIKNARDYLNQMPNLPDRVEFENRIRNVENSFNFAILDNTLKKLR